MATTYRAPSLLVDNRHDLEAPFSRNKQKDGAEVVPSSWQFVLYIITITFLATACARCSRSSSPLSRNELIARRIVDASISTKAILKSESSPQHAALHWITSVDPLNLDPRNEYLTQRYALAVVWFAFHDQMFIKKFVSDSALPNQIDLSWANETNWMSASGHCNWFGVSCRPQQVQQDGDSVSSKVNNKQFNYDGSSDVLAIVMPTNKIRGSVPSELFSALSSLQMLVLDENVLLGTLPTMLSKASHLQVLSMQNNFLSGPIPSLHRLSNLMDLNLSDNELSGTISTEVSNLSNIRELYLDVNHLTGTIPSTLGLLPKLVDLRLSDNKLKGVVPAELGNMGSLQVLELDHNDLTGTIPREIGYLGQLIELQLYHNGLGGTIPSELGNLFNMKTMYLDHNILTGSIPSSIQHLRSLSKFQSSFL